MTLKTGQTLGRYQLEALQGSGGMAQVFKAWDPNTGRYVAIKVLHQHLIDESVFKERFAREGQLIASLSHPNIVTLYDFDAIETDNGISPYMVMPFIDGPSLKDRLESLNAQGQRMPLDEVMRIVEGIAAALDYAHGKDMVHRDIKPGNILFNDQGAPLLTDFGLARLTFGARLTDSGTASGTPAYMAPEQGLGEPGDRRSDIYSLGIILHELLTGQLPFVADTGLGLLMKHIHEPLPSPRLAVPELPPEVEAVVFRAAAKDPASRYPTAGALAAELRTAIEQGVVSPQTLRVSRRHDRAARRGIPWPIVAGAGLGLLAVLAIVLLASQTRAPQPTPTVPAVSAMTAGPVPFSTSFDPDDEYNLGWPIREEGLFTTAIRDGQYVIQSSAPGQAHTATFLPDEYRYSALIIETDATLLPESQPDSGYGIVFRYENEDSYYVFAINGRQQVSIWLRRDGAWLELRGGADEWTYDAAVHPMGELNHLSILAHGGTLTGYVNGKRVVQVEDDTIREGGVGFYIATTVRQVERVQTGVAFNNFLVTNVVPSMSG